MYNETTDIKILRRKNKNEYLIKRNISKKNFMKIATLVFDGINQKIIPEYLIIVKKI